MTIQAGSKTPYEIRLELLQMAKDHLDTTFKMQAEFNMKLLEKMASLTHPTNFEAMQKHFETLQKLQPVPYTLEDVTKKAMELYSFVCLKK